MRLTIPLFTARSTAQRATHTRETSDRDITSGHTAPALDCHRDIARAEYTPPGRTSKQASSPRITHRENMPRFGGFAMVRKIWAALTVTFDLCN